MEQAARQRGFRVGSLRKLCALLMGFRMSKKQQCSNWARLDLTTEQIKYAATDAWVSQQLALRLLLDD